MIATAEIHTLFMNKSFVVLWFWIAQYKSLSDIPNWTRVSYQFHKYFLALWEPIPSVWISIYRYKMWVSFLSLCKERTLLVLIFKTEDKVSYHLKVRNTSWGKYYSARKLCEQEQNRIWNYYKLKWMKIKGFLLIPSLP